MSLELFSGPAEVIGRGPFSPGLSVPAVPNDIWWCLAACSAVIVFNVTRVALIGLHPEYFELIHGTVGASIASFLDLSAIVGINLIRVRREFFARS